MSVFYVCMTVFVIEVPCGSSSSCYIEEVRQPILLYCLKSCIFPQTVWLKKKKKNSDFTIRDTLLQLEDPNTTPLCQRM